MKSVDSIQPEKPPLPLKLYMFAVNPIHKDNLESGLINIFFGKSHSDIA